MHKPCGVFSPFIPFDDSSLSSLISPPIVSSLPRLRPFFLSPPLQAKCQELSGGMSRKACAAVAMLGTEVDRSGRVVVLLDEITAGVDVSARRRMWRSIQDRTDSFSGILCTHHMEEAESLCTRIAILIGGVIRAEGTAQELKHQYVDE